MQHGNDRANSIMQITVVQFQSTEVKKKKNGPGMHDSTSEKSNNKISKGGESK